MGLFSHQPKRIPSREEMIGDHHPVVLRSCLLLCWKMLLRGGQEQRNLKMSRFVQCTDLDCFTYRIVPNFSAEQNADPSRHLGIVGLRLETWRNIRKL